jgi:hypothetical protein
MIPGVERQLHQLIWKWTKISYKTDLPGFQAPWHLAPLLLIFPPEPPVVFTGIMVGP